MGAFPPDSFMKLKCPSCSKLLQIPEAAAGKAVRCSCGKTLRVPAARTSATPATTAAGSNGATNAGKASRASGRATAPAAATPASRSAPARRPQARRPSPALDGGRPTPDLFDELAENDFEPVRSNFGPSPGRHPTGGPANPYSVSSVLGSEGASGQYRDLASPFIRIVAKLLDVFLTILIACPFVGFGLYQLLMAESADGATVNLALAVSAIVGGVALNVLLEAVPLSIRGQTLGKMAFGIVIVDQNTMQPVGFLKGYLVRMFVFRSLANAVPVVSIIVYIVDAVFLFLDGHETLHDKMAGTIVCNVPSR